jgi:hypothetical protein
VRGATHGDKERGAERASDRVIGRASDRASDRTIVRTSERGVRPRATSLSATDEFERVLDESIVETSEAPDVVPLRLLVLESAGHVASAQGAVVASGHVVVGAASGRDGLARLLPAVGDVDAVLVGLPGGEPLIDLARAHPRRPVVIAASTGSASEAVRRAVAAGADLAAVRPYDLEQLAPTLLAATRLAEQRRQPPPAPVLGELAPGDSAGLEGLGDLVEPGDSAEMGELDLGLCAFERLVDAGMRELARAKRYGYALTVALFSVEFAPPAPPPALRGIVRARCGNALVHALRDIDLASELEQDRFLVLMPLTERAAGADVARRIISAVASGDPVASGGRTFPPRMVGAVVTAVGGEPGLDVLLADVTQLLEQAHVTGASLAVET